MDRADLYRIYELGAAVQPLSHIADHWTLAQVFGPLYNAKSAINTLLGSDPQAKVDLCRQAAAELMVEIESVERSHFWDREKDQFAYPKDTSEQVQPFFAWSLRAAVQNFQAVFRAEMQSAATYWVPKRGAYSTRELVDHFENSFIPELHVKIGDVALAEYRNAGRCFAFGLWSAAGYHACRAVEAVLRSYFSAYTGESEEKVRNWGGLLHKLNLLKEAPKPKQNTLFYLQQLKDNDRNPLMHVRIVLKEQDADVLLNAAKVCITLMAREMIDLDVEKAATPLFQIVGKQPA